MVYFFIILWFFVLLFYWDCLYNQGYQCSLVFKFPKYVIFYGISIENVLLISITFWRDLVYSTCKIKHVSFHFIPINTNLNHFNLCIAFASHVPGFFSILISFAAVSLATTGTMLNGIKYVNIMFTVLRYLIVHERKFILQMNKIDLVLMFLFAKYHLNDYVNIKKKMYGKILVNALTL